MEHPENTQVEESKSSPALSMANTPHSASTQKVAVLIDGGFNGQEVKNILNALQQQNVFIHIVSENLGTLTGDDGTQIKVDETFKTKHPVLYDAFYIVGGKAKDQEKFNLYLMEFYSEAYKYFKPIGIATSKNSFMKIPEGENPLGVVFSENNDDFTAQFIEAIKQMHFWDRK